MVYLGDKEIHVDHVEREKNEAMASRMGSRTKGALRASECQHVTSVFREKLAVVRKVDW